MKTLLTNVAVLFSVCLFSIPASAVTSVSSPLCTQDTIVKKDTTVKENTLLLAVADEVTYTKIEKSTIPAAVSQGVSAKYEGYTIEEAYKGSDNSYKLIIKKENASLTVYFNEAGNFQKEESSTSDSNKTLIM